MNDWPEGWSGDNRGSGYGRGSASARPESARVMRQVRRGATPPSGPGPSAPPYGAGVPQQPSY
ncbi:LytR family transcriptional regulator, partial [Streptomyces sp. SID5926]|nr:LytR family transcriptional regulator [Streptomyces sp. SID5926]